MEEEIFLYTSVWKAGKFGRGYSKKIRRAKMKLANIFLHPSNRFASFFVIVKKSILKNVAYSTLPAFFSAMMPIISIPDNWMISMTSTILPYSNSESAFK